MKFISNKAQNSNIVASILNSTQQPGCIFVTSLCPRDFVQMASIEPFSYHSGLWLLLNLIVLSQTCSKLSIEDSQVDNRLEKNEFADLMKDAKSVTVLCPTNFESDRVTSHKCGLAAMTVSNGSLLSHLLLRKDRRHFWGWNFGEWKSWMFTCYWQRQKSKLEWPSQLINLVASFQ